MNKNGLLYTIFFCFIITFAFVFLLSLANVGTQEFVELNQQVAIYRAILNALGVDYNPADRDDVLEKFAEVEELENNGNIYYRAMVNGEPVFALRTSGPGLWGIIEVVVGFNQELNRYTGLEIIDQNETPGLGGRIADEWFKEQFRGQSIPGTIFDGGMITMASAGVGAAVNKDDNMVDAITGASRTSDAIQRIVSEAAREMMAIVGGNQ